MEIIILGVPYTVLYKSSAEDKILRECDGYCDKSSHKIVINTENGDLDDFPRYQKQCLCRKENCAWWVEDKQKCAIAVGGERNRGK